MASARRIGTNENISSYDSGGGRDYTSLATWEAATDVNLVTSTTSETLECYGGIHNDTVVLDAATTSSIYFRAIRPAPGEGHTGQPGTGVGFDSTGTTATIDVGDLNTQIHDLLISLSGTTASTIAALDFSTGGSGAVVGCIVYDSDNTGIARGIQVAGPSQPVSIVDCIVLRSKNANIHVQTTGTVNIYNCVVIDGFTQGINRTSGTAIAKNCVSSGNASADFAGTFDAESEANASADATAVGAGALINQTLNFTDAGSDDYTFPVDDDVVRGRGANLSADGNFAFDDDMFGNLWLRKWSMGIQWLAPSARYQGVAENISTYDTAGGADYTALSSWEADTDINLVTAKQSEVLECAAGTHDDAVTLDGATTSSSFFRIIRPAPGAFHGGVPGAGVNFVRTTGGRVIQIGEGNCQIQDLCGKMTFNDASEPAIFNSFSTAVNASAYVGCIAYDGVNTGAGTVFGFSAFNITSISYVNCVSSVNDGTGFWVGGTGTARLSNCTSVGNGTGFLRDTTIAAIANNCLSSGNTTADFTGTFDAASTANASSDNTAPGIGFLRSQTFDFVDSPSGNYALTSTDTTARGRGVNLSTDSIYNFDDDLVKASWLTRWSIGASWTSPSARRRGIAENVSTYDSAGGQDYTSLATWEADTDNNLVSTTTSEVLELFSGEHTDTFSLAGATTSDRFFRILRPASGEGHDGTPGTGARIVATTSFWAIAVLELNASIQDLALSWTGSTSSTPQACLFGLAGSGDATGVLVHDVTNGGSGGGRGFTLNLTTAPVYLVDCLIANNKTEGVFISAIDETAYVLNCTSVDNGTYGYQVSAATVVEINCIGNGNSTQDFSGTVTGNNNASGDTTASGTSPRISQNFTFADAGSDDYHLAVGDAGAQTFGADLSAYYNYPFNDDVDGEVASAPWDIGFDFFVGGIGDNGSGATGLLVYRRRRRNHRL